MCFWIILTLAYLENKLDETTLESVKMMRFYCYSTQTIVEALIFIRKKNNAYNWFEKHFSSSMTSNVSTYLITHCRVMEGRTLFFSTSFSNTIQNPVTIPSLLENI